MSLITINKADEDQPGPRPESITLTIKEELPIQITYNNKKYVLVLTKNDKLMLQKSI